MALIDEFNKSKSIKIVPLNTTDVIFCVGLNKI